MGEAQLEEIWGTVKLSAENRGETAEGLGSIPLPE